MFATIVNESNELLLWGAFVLSKLKNSKMHSVLAWDSHTNVFEIEHNIDDMHLWQYNYSKLWLKRLLTDCYLYSKAILMHTRKLLLHINYNNLNSLKISCSYKIPRVFQTETLNAKDMQILNMRQLFCIILKRKGGKKSLRRCKTLGARELCKDAVIPTHFVERHKVTL